MEAVKSLKGHGYVKGPIISGAFHLSVTFKGACWLLEGAALLELVEWTTWPSCASIPKRSRRRAS